MEVEMLNAVNHIKHIRKKQVTSVRIYLVINKHKNWQGVNWKVPWQYSWKNPIYYHQRNRSYNVPGITEDTVLVELTQETDNHTNTIWIWKSPKWGNSFMMNESKIPTCTQLKPKILQQKWKHLKVLRVYGKKILELNRGRYVLRF